MPSKNNQSCRAIKQSLKRLKRRTTMTTATARRSVLARGCSSGRSRITSTLSKYSVERKVRKLQRLVPGGRGMTMDLLFLHTADYILQLRLQLHLLRSLAGICIHPSAGNLIIDSDSIS